MGSFSRIPEWFRYGKEAFSIIKPIKLTEIKRVLKGGSSSAGRVGSALNVVQGLRILKKHKEDFMSSSTTDKLKGRLKEAAGALTGDEDLKKEGQRDQAAAKVKGAVEKVIDKAKDLVGGQKKNED